METDGRDGGEPQSQHQRRGSAAQKLTQFSSGLSRPFIQRPVMTMLLTASVLVFGILTYNQLAVNDLPAVDYPVLSVTASYPGADPVTMANTIATPLEKQFTQIPGISLITSASSQGNTSITIQFDLSKSIDAAAGDVQSAIQRAGGQLPADLPSPPTFTKANPNDQPVMYVALTSDTLTDGELYRYGTTEVAQRINILPGVSQVNIYGVKGAIRIKVDPGKLATRNMTFDDLAAAVKAGTAYSGAGQFDGKNKSFTLRPQGQLDTADGYRDLIVKRGPNGTPVYLRDVARVVEGVENERLSRHFFARGFNPPASVIVFAVSRQAGANAVQVARSVRELLPELQRQLPGSIRMLPTFDRSQSIVNSLHDVQFTLMVAFALVIFVIFVFLGRASDTLIPMVALPMSFLITFVAMWWLGYSINNLTLMALTLAIGFLVDDALVGGSFHSARLHAWIARSYFPRIRHHDHRCDSRVRLGLTHAHTTDVLAHSERARPRTSQNMDGALRRPLLQSYSRCLRSNAALVSRPRLDRRANLDRVCVWRLVFLQATLVHTAADRRQRRHPRVLSSPGGRITRPATTASSTT